MAQLFCPTCGKALPEGSYFCPICGRRVEAQGDYVTEILPKSVENDKTELLGNSSQMTYPGSVQFEPESSTKKSNVSWLKYIGIIGGIIALLAIGLGSYLITVSMLDRNNPKEHRRKAVSEKRIEDDASDVEKAEGEAADGESFVAHKALENEDVVAEIPAAVEEVEAEEPEEPSRTPKKLNVINAYASSELDAVSVDRKTYYARNTVDGDIHTAWLENAKGVGNGEWLTLVLDEEHEITEIDFYGGFLVSQYRYTINGKPATVRVDFSDGTVSYLTTHFLSQGEDNTSYYRSDVEPDCLFFDEPIRASSVTFTIESASRGTKYEDTAISEIEIYGY